MNRQPLPTNHTEEQSEQEIAQTNGYDIDCVKQTSSHLWQVNSWVLGATTVILLNFFYVRKFSFRKFSIEIK